MMKRMATYFVAICFAALVCAAVPNAQAADSCKRKDLEDITEKYFASLHEHSTSALPLASNIKFTENGVEKEVGKSFWETAGEPLLKRTLIDTEKCGTGTIAVMEERFTKAAETPVGGGMTGGMMGAKPKPMPAEGTIRPILFAVRLKVNDGKITEIETIIARENEFAFNADGLLETKDQNWETILPPDQRTPRKVMIEAADNYFNMFAKEPMVSVPFAKVCDRWENGTQTTKGGSFAGGPAMPAHDCSPKGLVISNHGPRRFLVDTEKGIAAAYVLFAGGLPDCHMFKMVNGKVEVILAVVGAGSKTMGWPNEPAE
jgi:hypothetical protein